MAKSSLSRREFLKVSALSSSALALSGCSSLDRYFIGDKRDLRNEVVILGAGAAGLAAAFELKKKKIPFRIFEASPRVGGRVQSVSIFPEGGPVAEVGAEFFEDSHAHVFSLAKELNLPVNEVKTIPGLEAHLFSFNKKIYQVKDIATRLKTLQGSLRRVRRDLFQEQDVLLSFENSRHYERSTYFDSLSLKDLLDSWTHEVDPLILKLIEIQAVARFGAEAKDQSSLHFLSTIDEEGTSLLAGHSMYRMEGGLSRLTQTLAARIAGVIPDQILKMNCPLVKISDEQDIFALTFDCANGKETYRTRNIICTIPFSKLREVAGIDQLKLSSLKKENIRMQSYGTHSKGVLAFANPFWRVRHGTIPGRLGNYTGDFVSQKIWDSGRGQIGKQGLLTYQRGGISGLNAGAASPSEALKDLSLFQGDIPSTRVSTSQFVNWDQRKWARGSMAVFGPGQYTHFKGAAAKPEYDGRFLFAGEHTSLRYAGTLQGALESGLQAASAIAAQITVQG